MAPQPTPILVATDAQKPHIIECVENILVAKNSNNYVVLETSEVSTSDADIPVLESVIDRLVNALYGLTEEEIALVEGR